MPHLSSRSDIKGFPLIDKSYLLRLPMVMVKMSPINSIADFETHLHDIHSTLQHLSSQHTTRISQTDNLKLSRNFLQRRKSIWQQLVYRIRGHVHCFLNGCITEFLVADVLPTSKLWVDGLQIPLRSLGKISLNHVWNLPATSQMYIRVAWSDMGVSLHAPSALRPGTS